MKTDITHLPVEKQEELGELVHIIRDYSSLVAMIILFGSYARGNWVEEKYEDNIHYQYQSDFDVLLVVDACSDFKQTKIERELEDIIDQNEVINTPVTILVHDIDFLNRRLKKAQYFFSDIKREGVFLYNSGCLQLKKSRKLSLRERQCIAKEDFEYWFDGASKLFVGFKFYLKSKFYNQAAFELHQTTEQLYTTILLVFTRYKPNTHDIRTLRKMVNSLDDRFAQIFLFDTQENKRLFDLLRAAYIGARYKKSYVITHEELKKLQEKVGKLQLLTQQLCQEKIDSLKE